MTRQLVFIHGIAQQDKDPDKLKAAWVESLRRGLAKNGLELPIAESEIRFPYYGDTLANFVHDIPADEVARVIVRGDGGDTDRLAFFTDALEEVCNRTGISEQEVAAADAVDAVEKGPQDWRWVRAIARALDTKRPAGTAIVLQLVLADVYDYLVEKTTKQTIDDGVSTAFTTGVETVVVGHSLGSVVAQSILSERGTRNGWVVPQLITVGCPLAISRIKQATRIPRFPGCVEAWLNARDDRDIVALYPLSPDRFPIGDETPPIVNRSDVENWTGNRHGIVGYLDDAALARTIHQALTMAKEPTSSRE